MSRRHAYLVTFAIVYAVSNVNPVRASGQILFSRVGRVTLYSSILWIRLAIRCGWGSSKEKSHFRLHLAQHENPKASRIPNTSLICAAMSARSGGHIPRDRRRISAFPVFRWRWVGADQWPCLLSYVDAIPVLVRRLVRGALINKAGGNGQKATAMLYEAMAKHDGQAAAFGGLALSLDDRSRERTLVAFDEHRRETLPHRFFVTGSQKMVLCTSASCGPRFHACFDLIVKLAHNVFARGRLDTFKTR